MIRTISILLLFPVMVAPAYARADGELPALFAEYWESELANDPFLATHAGENAYDDRVPQVSPADHAMRNKELARLYARLLNTDFATLVEDERISAEILRFILKHELALGKFGGWRTPFNSDSGFHADFGFVVGSMPFRNEDDYRTYLRRLEALPEYLDQHVANMRAGLRQGFTQPAEILENILPSFAAQVVDNAREHPAFAPFEAFPAAMAPKTQNELREAGLATLTEKVIPAFARVHEFMRDQYVPGARKTLGASELPHGVTYYEALVRYYTSLDEATPASIHARGLAEVARIRAEMEAVIEDSGFSGSFAEFLEFLRTDPQFYAKTAEELLMRAAWYSKTIDGRLPAFFGKLPRQPYSVEPVPAEIAANYTGGRYVAAPPGGTRGGRYWVNTYALHTRALYQLPALSLHEAVPGHHLQSALAYEIENAPEFRRQFYPHAYGEGWGLYSEKLGVEMGIYVTPYEHFGRLSYEMWRACRLVVDTGLHAQGWTRREAQEYLAGNTALSLHEVQTEVDRYISWPGQALAYKMGEMTIWELRARAERILGDAFDVRDFHDAILARGGLPLDLLRQQIERYIEKTDQSRGN